MRYIILRTEEQNYHIIDDAANELDALKQYIEYCFSGDLKIFNILADSGKLDLSELVAYANNYLLCNYAAIGAIYSLGDKIF